MAARQYLLVAAGMAAAIGAAPACSDDTATGGNGGEGGEGAGNLQFEPAPGGIRRLTTSQIRYSLEYMFGPQAAEELLVWEDQQNFGFESIAASEAAIGINDVATLETEVTGVVATALQNISYLAQFAPCVESSPGAACYDEVVTELGRVAWRRPVEDDERGRLLNIATIAQEWGAGDFDVGLDYMLRAILQSPNFLYQVEIGEGPEDNRTLSPYELASRISLFVVHRIPDVELLDAAESGALTENDGIRDQARRMLATPEARRSLDRFFGELYRIREIPDSSKDPVLYPDWNDALAQSMQEEMLRFLQDVVWTRDADAREIYTSTSTFVDATLAAFYGVASPGGGWQKVELPAEHERIGLLGKAGFLTRYGNNDVTSPVKRGRFYRERVLCREIPPPPAGVDTTLPAVEGPVTMRERLAPHSENANCAGCHSLMDPIGLAYEHFDSIGKYRETDQGLEIITADESGDLEFEGPSDLAQYAYENGAACLVKNFWRQATGHLETEGEEDSLTLLEMTFADRGHSLQELIVELTVSPAFKRVGEPK